MIRVLKGIKAGTLILFLCVGTGFVKPLGDVAPSVRLFMMDSDSNNMHADGSASDTHVVNGPIQPDANVRRFVYGRLAGECAGFAFDSKKRIITVCAKAGKSELLMIDPITLNVVDRFSIPKRRGTFRAIFALKFKAIFSDTSGGSYFYLDNEGRAIIATSDRRILRVKQVDSPTGTRFVLDREYSLLAHVPADCPERPDRAARAPLCDKVTTALPDKDGQIWFVTRKGRVGILAPESGRIKSTQFPGEEIQNSFAVADDGIFVVTDHALYKMTASSTTGRPEVVWRETYDRGTSPKAGQVGQGSGTTPTLIDTRYIAIADSADSRINALVFRRNPLPGQSRLICKVPLFTAGASATDNSFISYGQSLIIENNSGYTHAFHSNRAVGGIVRIDIRIDETGCDTVWQNDAISPSTVPKLSRKSELIYTYTVTHRRGRDDWALTAIDYRTGRTIVTIPTGRGMRVDNNWASIALGPEPGMALIGTITGFIQVQDRP